MDMAMRRSSKLGKVVLLGLFLRFVWNILICLDFPQARNPGEVSSKLGNHCRRVQRPPLPVTGQLFSLRIHVIRVMDSNCE
jgi:hypothetical protein